MIIQDASFQVHNVLECSLQYIVSACLSISFVASWFFDEVFKQEGLTETL